MNGQAPSCSASHCAPYDILFLSAYSRNAKCYISFDLCQAKNNATILKAIFQLGVELLKTT